MKKDLDGVDLAVLQVNVQLACGSQTILGPAHCGRFARGAERDVISRRIALFSILKRVKEHGEAPGNAGTAAIFPGGDGEHSGRATSADGTRAGVLNDEGESIRAFAESAGFGQLELKGGLKAGSDGLFVVKPSGAGPAFGRWGQAQHVAGDFGVAHHFHAVRGREIGEANGALSRHRSR